MTKCLLIICVLISFKPLAQKDWSSLVKDFYETENDSAFVVKHSKWPFKVVELERLGKNDDFDPLDSTIFYRYNEGDIVGPIESKEGFLILKILEVDSSFAMEVSHIILTTAKRSREEMLELANLLHIMESEGKEFKQLAKEYSEDGAASSGGYLGLFFQDVMVAEFEREILKHKINDCFIVETVYGVHLVKMHMTPEKQRRQVNYTYIVTD